MPNDFYMIVDNNDLFKLEKLIKNNSIGKKNLPDLIEYSVKKMNIDVLKIILSTKYSKKHQESFNFLDSVLKEYNSNEFSNVFFSSSFAQEILIQNRTIALSLFESIAIYTQNLSFIKFLVNNEKNHDFTFTLQKSIFYNSGKENTQILSFLLNETDISKRLCCI